MKVYTIREAARETKIGMEALKRACEEGLINAIALSNGQWRIAESALEEALHKGIDLRSLPKRVKKMKQPEALRKAQEEIQKNRAKAAVAATSTTTKPTNPTKSKKTSK